jgi:hypothetical protein
MVDRCGWWPRLLSIFCIGQTAWVRFHQQKNVLRDDHCIFDAIATMEKEQQWTLFIVSPTNHESAIWQRDVTTTARVPSSSCWASSSDPLQELRQLQVVYKKMCKNECLNCYDNEKTMIACMVKTFTNLHQKMQRKFSPTLHFFEVCRAERI